MRILCRLLSILFFVSLSSLAFADDPAPAVQPPQGKLTHFGNWIVLCPPDGDTSGVRCAAQFSLVDKKRKIPVIVWRIGFNKKQTMVMDMVTPTEVFIAKGVRLAIGKSAAIILPYVSCGLRGCQSNISIPPELLAAMKLSKDAILILAPTNGKILQLKLDVSGLGEALSALGAP